MKQWPDASVAEAIIKAFYFFFSEIYRNTGFLPGFFFNIFGKIIRDFLFGKPGPTYPDAVAITMEGFQAGGQSSHALGYFKIIIFNAYL